MPHVSKRELSETVQNKIQNLFLEELTRIADKKEMGEFLGKLLTDSEKIMLPKRLAAYVMINQGIPDLKISRSLNLTTETVMRYRLIFSSAKEKNEPISEIVQKMSLKKEMKQLLKEFLRGYAIPAMFGRAPKKGFF